MRRLSLKPDDLEIATRYIHAAANLCGNDAGMLKPHEFKRLIMHLVKSISLLSNYQRRENRPKSDYDIVLKIYNEQHPEWKERNRKDETILARYTLVYFLREYTTLTLQEIGIKLGEQCKRRKFDHSTMVHAYNSVIDMLETNDPQYTEIVYKMESIIQDILGITEQKQIEAV
jgi:hypothetical protein